jgi:hypothetical protein
MDDEFRKEAEVDDVNKMLESKSKELLDICNNIDNKSYVEGS